jgi:hypothetical protein
MSRLVPPIVAGLVLLSGCMTGERPTLAESPTTTGDPAVDAVLDRLDAADEATFTAGYDVLTKFGNVSTPATVSQSGPTKRSVTIGSVRFVTDGATTATCDLDDGTCSDSIDAARVSDTQLTPDFNASSAAARVRRDAGARVDATSASTTTIGGQSATCVTIPVTGAASTYCALDSGPLARLDAADLSIEMTSYSPSLDESLFARSG